jgi:hypothetical protein
MWDERNRGNNKQTIYHVALILNPNPGKCSEASECTFTIRWLTTRLDVLKRRKARAEMRERERQRQREKAVRASIFCIPSSRSNVSLLLFFSDIHQCYLDSGSRSGGKVHSLLLSPSLSLSLSHRVHLAKRPTARKHTLARLCGKKRAKIGGENRGWGWEDGDDSQSLC